jgi:hypothetical protein
MALTCKVGIHNITNIGDYVWCKYNAFANTIGTFSDFATKTDEQVGSDIIPTSSSLTPNGYFKFIFAGYDSLARKKLIADRNIQHSINWNAINDIGINSNLKFSSLGMYPLIPLMTSNTLPSGRAFSSPYNPPATGGATYEAWHAMNLTKYSTDTYYYATSQVAHLGYEFESPKSVKYYRIDSVSTVANRSPKTWTFEGSNDGENWTILDERINQPSWSSSTEARYFNIPEENVGNYLMYRINVSSTFGGNLAIDVFQLYDNIDLYDEQKYNITMKLLSGGNSSLEKENEWDKIIVESTLNGNIVASDNNVWNYSGVSSWTSTSFSTGANRVIRGNYNPAWYSNSVTTTTNTIIGFRPMLILDDSVKCYFFILDGDKYKSIVNGNLVTHALTTDNLATKENAFLNYGMLDLSLWTNSLKSQIENSSFKIACYRV